MCKAVLATVAALASISTWATATTWIVAQDGSGDFVTIQEAANAAADGDSILVHPGVYHESITLQERSLYLASLQGFATTKLDGDNVRPMMTLIDCDSLMVVEGFTFQRGWNPDDGGGMVIDRGAPRIRANDFKWNRTDGSGGAVYCTGSALIENNLFRGNELLNEFYGHGGAVFLWNSAGSPMTPVVRGNVFDYNWAPGLSGTNGALHVDVYPGHSTIDRNTFVRNFRNGITFGPGENFAVTNCLFIDHEAGVGLRCASELGEVWLDCLAVDHDQDLLCDVDPSQVGGHFFLIDDPLFCRYEFGPPTGNEDYHLDADSPIAPDATPCGQIGAFGVGCGTVAVGQGVPPPAQLRVLPNPTSGSTAVILDLPWPSEVALSVFDAAGRLVATLPQGPLAARRQALRWSATDATGHRLPAGVYFLRLDSATSRATAKVLLID